MKRVDFNFSKSFDQLSLSGYEMELALSEIKDWQEHGPKSLQKGSRWPTQKFASWENYYPINKFFFYF